MLHEILKSMGISPERLRLEWISASEGSKFKEETILENISSGGAYFSLDSGITVGSKLNLVVEIPSKVTEGKKIKLRLGGLTVRLHQLDKEGKKQGIALSFDEDFQFEDEEK